MGAQQFSSQSRLTDAKEAFRECIEEAAYDYGHAGYTGTIAEKDSYVVWEYPADKTLDESIKALEGAAYDSPLSDWIPAHIAEAYDDKWGPAVALPKRDKDGWVFVGFASS